MAEQGGEEKTEKATPKKLRDARKEGDIFQSKEVAIAFSTVATFSLIKVYLHTMYSNIVDLFNDTMFNISQITELGINDIGKIFTNAVYTLAICILPILLIGMLVGIISYGAQTRFLFTSKKLMPKFSKMNPLKGIKNMFSFRSLFELLKSVLKLVIIVAIIYSQFMDLVDQSLKLMSFDLMPAIMIIFDSVYNLALKLSLVFFAIAIVDYFYQRFDYSKRMKMTKKEVKEEFKQTEGDPQIKGRIRQMQRKMSQARMMQAVKDADVIVRNPTHFAIALKYDPEKSKAPVVLAKGQDYVALRIIDEASKYEIPMMENRPLARALYKDVELGREITPNYYTAIAEVLAWVHSLGKLKALQKN